MLRLPVLCLALMATGVRLCSAQDLPPVPQGIEVQARGPVHEAYASPTTEPVVPKAVSKQPPPPIDEVPPAEKPEGEVIWVSGYWAWDDDRSDFLWVSGIWRTSPPNKQWVAGYWRQEGTDWQWVPGFWTVQARANEEQQVTYLPAPPAAPDVVPPAKPPTTESFYVPGSWVWTGDRYVWRAGYWARMQPGYVWVSDHYRWTPSGYVYVAGYWDLALKRRGILYAPVIIRPEVVTVGFTYTPAYAVRDTVIVEAMFVHPTTCHYYFGDYYGPRYRTLGYESCVVYSRRRYDSIVVYECYERRDPSWVSIQVNLYNDRCSGRVPVPPRTLVQQNTVVNNNTTIVNNNITMIAPTTNVAVTKNTTLVKLDDTTRQQARAQATAVQQVARQRSASEVATPAGAPRQARVASLSVPRTQPVKPGMKAPATPVSTPRTTSPATTVQSKPATRARPAESTKPAASIARPAATTTKPGVQPAVARPGTTTTPPRSTVQPASRWVPAVPTSKPTTTTPATKPTVTPTPTATAPKPAAQPTRPAPTKRPPPKDEKKKDR
jgi:hypothetical protein